MSWLATFFVASLTGILGLLASGFIASACVSWYRVSSFEGGAGYFVVATALLGGIAGFAIGMITSRLMATATPGFLMNLGTAAGVILGIALLALGLCYLLADIPPKIGGQELMLEMEFRLPISDTESPVGLSGTFDLGSLVEHTQRASRQGELHLAASRFEEGRWIVPAEVFLFTARGLRSVGAQIGDREKIGFLVPLPARPGSPFETWSEWWPQPPAGEAPWPATKASFRFRVRRIEPAPPALDPIAMEEEAFAALQTDGPLAEWLPFLQGNPSEERQQAVMEVAASRQEELAKLIASTEAAVREGALLAVTLLAQVTPEVAAAVTAEGKAILAAVQRFNTMPADAPESYGVQVDLRSRFSYWKRAWWTVQRCTGVDGRPPVQAICDAAQVRAHETSMSEIVAQAAAILAALPPTDGQAK